MWILLVACAAALAARQRPSQPSPEQPTYRAGTTLVEVDAIVTGRAGQFVADLSPADFEVLEDGEPQQVQTLYLVRGGSSSPVPPVSAGGAVREPRASSTVAGLVPPRVFVLFFDQAHLEQGAFERLQDAAVGFLAREFRPGDIGGVVVGGRMAGDQLTSDHAALVAAVRAARPINTQRSLRLDAMEWPRMSDVEAVRINIFLDQDVLAQVVRRAREEQPRAPNVEGVVVSKAQYLVAQFRESAGRTLAILHSLATGLGELPGRKTVVLLSDGFLMEEASGNLREVLGWAARTNVRFYAIDGKGLGRHHDFTDLAQMAPLNTGPAVPTEADNHIEDGPNMLAVDTGGYVVRNTNDFGEALAGISRDTSTYYVIGYQPSNTNMDGTYRRITVRVKRPDLHVRARRGYLATPSARAEAEPAPPEEPPSDESASVAVPPEAPTALPSHPVAPRAIVLAAPGVDVAGARPSAAAAVRLRPDEAERADVSYFRRAGAAPASPLPADLTAKARAGWEAYQRGDTKAAEAALVPVAANLSAPPWAIYVLGWAHLAEGNLPAAAAAWERVRASVPEFEQVYFDLADAYLQQRLGQLTLDVLQDAEARWPKDVEVRNAIGVVQTVAGRLDEAIATFQEAVALAPDDAGAGFNLARARELRLVAALEQGRSPKGDDLEVVARDYRRVAAIAGPLAAAAAFGARRTTVVDAKALVTSPPAPIASLTTDALGGEPLELAWAPDGSRFYVRAMGSRASGMAAHHLLVSVPDGTVTPAGATPRWEAPYWTWKAARTSPWLPSRRIEATVRGEAPLGLIPSQMRDQSRITMMHELRLGDEIVGRGVNEPVIWGATFSWAPYAMGALAFVDNGHLAILDAHGHKVRVRDTRNVLLPAWSDDGRRVAWLERDGKTYVLKVVEVSGG